MPEVSFGLLRDLAVLSDRAYAGNDLLASQTLPVGWRYVSPGELGMQQVGVTSDNGLIYRYNGTDLTVDSEGFFVGSQFPSNAMYVAINDALQKVVVVFRGTDPSSLSDPNYATVDDVIGSYPGIGYDDLTDHIADFAAAFNAVVNYVGTADTQGFGFELNATGHSLGGALAAELLNTSSSFNFGIGFGAPGMSMTLGNSFINFRHHNDPVGQLYADRFGFDAIILDSAYTIDTGLLGPHGLASYLADLARMAANGLESDYALADGLHVYLPLDFSDNETLTGSFGNDLIFGSWFRNTLFGSTGNDDIRAGNSSDTVYGGGGSDTIQGGQGFDDLRGEGGIDTIHGGIGDDIIYGGEETDYLFGDGDGDDLRGEQGADNLWGGIGNDTLYGGEGNDHLRGESGLDSYIGGIGADTFYFDASSVAVTLPIQVEQIWDYNQGSGSYDSTEGDVIDISAIVAAAGGTGQADAALWRIDRQFGSAYLTVDPDGTGTTYGWQTIAQLHGLPSSALVTVVTGTSGGTSGPLPVPSNPGSFSISPATRTVSEGTGTISYTITRPDATLAETVYVSTTFDRGSLNDGDYQGMLNQQLTFAAGQTSRTVEITINNDGEAELDETFGLIVQASPDEPAYLHLASASFTISANDQNSGVSFTTGSDQVWITPLSGSNVFDGLGGTDLLVLDYSGSAESVDVFGGGDYTNPFSIYHMGAADDVWVTTSSINTYNIEHVAIVGSDWDDRLQDGGSILAVFGGEGNDRFYLDFDSHAYGGAGNDAFNLNSPDGSIDGGAGTDQVWLGANFDGANSVNLLTGEAFNGTWNSIEVVNGSLGSGNDTVVGLFLAGAMRGGAGIDSLSLDYSAPLADGRLVQQVDGTTLRLSDGSTLSFGFSEFEIMRIVGTTGNDSMTGTQLYGLDGNDVLTAAFYDHTGYVMDGGRGDDQFRSISLGDVIYGGSGFDTIYFDLAHLTQDIVLDLSDGGGLGGVWHGVEQAGGNLGTGDDTVVAGFQLLDIYDFGGTDRILLDYSGAFADGRRATDITISTYTATMYVTVKLDDGTTETLYLNQFEQLEFIGTDGIDSLVGASGGNIARGGGGTDYLTGNAGADQLWGDSGDDTVRGAAGDDLLFGGLGNDLLAGEDGADRLEGGDGNDNLTGGLGLDVIEAGAGDDFILVHDIDASIAGGAGTDTLYLLLAQMTQAVQVDLAGQSVGGMGFTGIEKVQGSLTEFDDTLLGGSLATGGYFFDGGAGIDAISFDYSTANAAAKGVRNVSVGIDLASLTITFNDGSSQFVSLLNFERATIVGTGNGDTLSTGSAGGALFGMGGNDYIRGGTGDDTLDGGAGDDLLLGRGGSDTIMGGDGADTVMIHSLAGAVDGGAGSDYLIFDLTAQTQSQLIDLSAIDLRDPTSSYGSLTIANVEAISQIELGSGDDTLIYYSNFTFGRLNGGAGIDRAVLNFSEALYDGRTASSLYLDFSRPSSGSGWNLYTANLSDGSTYYLDLRNFESFDITGSLGNDFIQGAVLDDTLSGLAGNDTLDGAGGSDLMLGGMGNDIYWVDSQSDLVVENQAEGTDTVATSASIYLYANVENLTLASGAADIFGVGNALDNTVTGNAGGNLLLGGAGNDAINGGLGNDNLFGEDGVDTINGEGGVDYLVGGAGNDVLNGGADADAIYGEDGDDTITGGTTFDTDILVGNGGNDTLQANSGLGDYDILNGAGGNDTYFVDTPDDIIYEGAGEGTDSVIAGINGAGYYLWANVENCTLTGATPFAAGNELNNVLTGSAASNWLLGNDGNDTLNGKAGNDVLFGDMPGGAAGADIFVFDSVVGQDVVGDFHHGEDKIQLVGLYADFATTMSHFRQVGGDCALDLGDGSMIIFQGLQFNALTAGDFLFG